MERQRTRREPKPSEHNHGRSLPRAAGLGNAVAAVGLGDQAKGGPELAQHPAHVGTEKPYGHIVRTLSVALKPSGAHLAGKARKGLRGPAGQAVREAELDSGLGKHGLHLA